MKRSFYVLISSLTLAACTCGPPAEWPRVHVVSFAPEGTTLDDLPSIELMFDGPVATEAQIGTEIDASQITITPAVPVALHFRDRQTLVIRPTRSLAPGTRYTVALASTFPAVVPDDQRSHAFVHVPLIVVGITNADAAWFPPQSEVGIHFGLPVRGSDAAEHCTLTADDVHVAVVAASPETVATVVLVRAASALTAGTAYELACPDLVAAGGNEPMAIPIVTTLHAVPLARVVEMHPDENGTVTPDELDIILHFATPTPIDHVRAHVHISPEVAGFAGRWVGSDPTTIHQVVNLAASTDYTIHVDSALADQFDQTLAEDFDRAFRTTDASPRVSMQSGIYAVEAATPTYQIWSRNVRRLDVTCAFVPTARIPEILTSAMDYDPWYTDGQHDLGWADHGLTPVTFPIEHPDAHNHWAEDDVDLSQRCAGRGPAGRRGVYLAEVRAPDVEADRSGDSWWQYPYRVLANVTNMGVLMSTGPSSGYVWVAQISDGAPVANANVSVYDTHGTRVHRTRTDANGVALLPGSRQLLHTATPSESPASTDDDDSEGGDSEGDYEDDGYDDVDTYRAQRMIVIVESGNDVAALDGNWANGIQLYNFGVPADTTTGGETAVRGFILSDRGIYRPGERAHFKGFVRELAVGGLPHVPTQRSISVQIEDAQGSLLVDRRARLTAFGGFSFDYPLEEDAPTGDYYVRATVGTHTFRERFSVEEFRPVAFEVTRTDGGPAPAPGGEIALTFNASYLFGAPLANAPTTYEVQRRRRFLSFSEYPNYTFDDWSTLDSEYFWSRYATPTTNWVTDGRVQTDEQGNIPVRYTDTAATHGPQDYLVDVNVTDPTDQVVTERAVVTVHPTDFYLGLQSEEYVQAVGMPFAVHAVALTPDGHRVATPATLTLVHRISECGTGAGPDGWWNCTHHEETVWTRQLALSEGGVTIERIDPTLAGEFSIRLAAQDHAGRDVAASSMVWIIGPGEAFWSGDESVRMGMIASRDQYDVGDVARLVPQASLAGATALVALERDGILSTSITHIGEGVSAIEVPIEAAHAPNVFVSVAAIRGRTGAGDEHRPIFRMGVSNLVVSPASRRLDVAITTEHDDYHPGDTVNGTITVTSGGQPVHAELSLSAADEGVLQLISFQTPDPLSAFYRPWSLGVESSTNWNRIARPTPPLNAGDGEDGDDSGGESSTRTRSHFVSSAFWAPALVTDDAGHASFTFVAPDNLTAFRLMAAAADEADRFGSGDHRIRVRKELMLEPILPRFFGAGDHVDIGVSVHNETDAAGEIAVVVDPRGITIAPARRTQTIHVAAHGVERVFFSAQVAVARADAHLRFSATMGTFTDALEQTLPVRSAEVVEPRELLAGSSDGAMSADANLAFAAPTIAAESHLEITLDRSGLASLGPTLRYLVEYPYDGLEETVSGMLPLYGVHDLATSLAIPVVRDDTRIRLYTRQSIARIVRHQTGDGLFSFWLSTAGDPGLSAYAMFGLAQASLAGGQVRSSVLADGTRALLGWANAPARDITRDGNTMAMVAYVLALRGQADAGLDARLYEARAGLGPDGRAFLLRALVRAHGPVDAIATSITELVALAERTSDRATMPAPHDDAWDGSPVRSTALAVSALVEAASTDPIVPMLVRGLLAAQDGRGVWRNTQDDAFALLALADYARTRAGGTTHVTVRLGTTDLYADAIEGVAIVHIDRTLAQVAPGTLHIESDGPITYAARVLLARPPAQGDAASHGFTLERTYLDFATQRPIGSATVGQLITVRIAAHSDSNREHVALVDPLPAGFEVVNNALDTAHFDPDAEQAIESSYQWPDVELGDREARAFTAYFPTGDRPFQYVARATIAGTFTAPGAHIEALYEPDSYARTASSEIVVSHAP